MLSNSTPKQNVGSVSSSVKSQVRLVKGSKPLIRFKFYLDIKSHVICSKIEAKIKELGGEIDLFLVKEVTHVVSDKTYSCFGEKRNSLTQTTPKTPQTPLSSTILSNDSTTSAVESPFTPSESQRKKPRSRADAMLERARLQSTNTTAVNPLENARIWGIPIWSVEKILSWLEKVAASLLQQPDDLSTLKKKSKLKTTVKVEDLKPPFIKFEPLSRDARPIYKQLSVWPTINLNAEPGVSPFFVTNKKGTITKQTADSPKKKMIRKTRISLRSVKIDDTPTVQSGYCEICRVDYQDLPKHVRSDTHLSFVRDDANFLSLDSLITAGANVEAFLRLNGTSGKDVTTNNCTMFSRRSLRKSNLRNQIEIKINGDNSSTPSKKVPSSIDKSINNVRMTRSSSACEKTVPDITPAPISPALSDGVHHLRSKGQLWLPSNLLGTTAEDDGNPVKPNIKEAKSESRTVCEVEDESDEDDEQPLSKHLKTNHSSVNSKVSQNECLSSVKKKNSSSTKTSTTKMKRPTADDRLLSENRAYYKVEVLSSKLRSSATSVHKEIVKSRVQTPIVEEEETRNGDEEPPIPNDRLVVKFRRVRKSELSTLSNEAENFMFPRRDSSSENDDCETDEERHTTGGFTSQDISSDIKSSEADKDECSKMNSEMTDDCSQDCSVSVLSSCESDVNLSGECSRKKRRRTHAEVFIQDNEKYYKFETPGSRLRFQGSFLPLMTGHTPSSSNALGDKIQKTEQEVNEERRYFESSLNNCNTSKIPMDQVSYTFERLTDHDTIQFFANRASQVERDFKLFIEMHCPKFIPLPLPYETNIPLMPRDPASCKENLLKRLKAQEETITQPPSDGGNSETNHSEVNSNVDVMDVIHEDQISNSSSKQSTDKLSTKRRRKLLNPGKNPRKSPRQHASTLAILGGLLQQRRRNTKSIESEGDCLSLPPINEQNESSLSVCPSPIPQETNECKLNLDLDNLEVNEEDFAEIDNIIVEHEPPIDCKSELQHEDHNFIHILNTYRESTVLETGMKEKWNKDNNPLKKNGLFQGNYSLFTPKEFRRKCRRKKNRTGWPNKRRVLSRRHFRGNTEVADDSDVITLGAMCDNTSDMYNNSLEPQQGEKRRGRRGRKKLIKGDNDYLRNSNKGLLNETQGEVECSGIENKENSSRAGPSQTPRSARSDSPVSISPSRNPSRNPSSDCLGFTVEERADVEKWGDNVDNILNAKIVESLSTMKGVEELKKSTLNDRRSSIEFQPYVKVQKIETIEPLHQTKIENNRRLRSSSSPNRSSSNQPKRKRMKIAPVSPPLSPRKLRKPRGRWYRDR